MGGFLSSDGAWADPKWLVGAVGLAAFGLFASYDIRLGMAAGALLGTVVLFWLYLALRYGSLSGAPSGRNALAARVREQTDNRRAAAARSGAQQGADPAERP